MEIETTPTGVSDADPAVIAGEQAPEATPEAIPEATPEAALEAIPADEAPASDPISKRERAMADLAEKRKDEQAAERKTAALMNEPEMSSEEYDAKLAASKESPHVEAPAGKEDVQPAGEVEGVIAEGAGERGANVDGTLPATPQNGWRTNDDGVRVKTLMVNGEAREITEEQFDRMAQKELAGDEKLREAARAEQVLNRRRQALDAQEQRLQEQVNQPPAQGAGESLNAAIAEHTELLLEGDTDAANAKMAEIIGMGRASSTPNIDEIAARAATLSRQQDQQDAHETSVNDGWESFKADYSDVVADSDALAFADIQIKNIRNSSPGLSPKEVILEAGRRTRERLHMGGAPAPNPGNGNIPNLTAERQARKGNIRPLPSVGGQRNEAKPEPVVDQTPQAKIARMRAGRAR